MSQAAESTFGTSAWPADRVVPQAWLELEVAKPEAVGEAVAELRGRGLEVVAEAKVEPWGQTTARLLSPEGLLVGVSHLPSFHETDDAGAATDETTDEAGAARSTLDLDTARRWLEVAVAQAREGEAEGGVPIGAALFWASGELLGSGRNRRVQDDDPSVHGETDAFRRAGRQTSYAGTTMVTTLSPCWYCSGLVRQFGISRVVVGEARTFSGGHEWLAEHGVEVVVLDDPGCVAMMADFVHRHPDVWNEDIGEGADGG
ncbi:deaminase [Terracoccus luteus]|uniref:tRNA(Arg) A34 adenosine deaminase TadA n=1 Tax=Terracoccus luteus TaxID=53356 RepID=A0A839Q4V7_9MICO|nr:deaminase [Terracoccus luteus]MBB2987661.1 tRNA(Arg) A34 adenosine deaminase TadA [Terracoccus luteus]MCP2173312.1 tRNA(Arg) A34 adenosine deaminase TadA [Terracoccus luteus]